MPGDKDAKTEEPTSRRKSEARNSGQVPKSQDLTATVLLLGGLLTLRFLGPSIWARMLAIYKTAFSSANPTDQDQLIPFAAVLAKEIFWMVGPFMLSIMVIGLLILYAQTGWLLTLKPLTPSLGKLNPITGVSRLFSLRSVMQLGQNIAKLSLVVLVAYFVLKNMAEEVIFSLALDHLAIVAFVGHLAFRLGVALALMMLVLALIDYVYQRYQHNKDLKMTKEEVKDELRSMEGDPVVKRRRREVQMQLAMQRLKQVVPEADVVVSNPTHVAVAIKYDTETMAAPKVIAKGVDQMAIRIRQLAAAAGIPILERPPLARALNESVEVGQEIPETFYQAIAEVLAYVYELAGRGMGPKPVSVG